MQAAVLACYIELFPMMKPRPGRDRLWYAFVVLLLCLIILAGCHRGKLIGGEYAYVSAPQVSLRDRLAQYYNKVGTARNGERVEVLERQKRWVHIRTSGGIDGWVEQRYLIGQDVYDGFQKLATENANAPAQGRGVTRAELNLHITPGRETDHLFQLKDGDKVELIKRATAEKPESMQPARPVSAPKLQAKTETKPGAKPSQASLSGAEQASPEQPPKVLEDWWLVRDQQKRVGWVLARMIDVDVPLDVAQYAEGQRIMAAFVLNEVQDEDKKVSQYLVLMSEPKDGMPFDYNQLRIFTWNVKRHRYETAYRERNLYGLFPVQVGHEVFDKEGDLPYFVIHAQSENGQMTVRKYKLNGPIVKRVLAPEEYQAEAAAKPAVRAAAPKRAAIAKPHRRHRR
jgi:hypothetical protein